MSERWKMNRIGFVNFWLYDEEDFEFEDGSYFCVDKTVLENHYDTEFYPVCTGWRPYTEPLGSFWLQ